VHPLVAELFGPDLIIVIIVVAVVLFGGSQIPKLARSLGSAQSEFKKGLSEGSGKTDKDKDKDKDDKAAGESAATKETSTTKDEGSTPASG